MDTQVKERKAAQRRVKDVLAPSINPDSVQSTAEEQQTDHAMKKMMKILKHRKAEPTTVQELVNHPQSFSQFVENIFTLSFLVKDGEAGLEAEAGEQRCPRVVRRQKPSEDRERSSFVMHLDMAGFRALQEKMGGMQGLIPNRAELTEEQLMGGGRTRS